MVVISQITFSNAFATMKIFVFFDGISLKFVHTGPIDTNLGLVQIMAWHRTGDKPLFGPKIA